MSAANLPDGAGPDASPVQRLIVFLQELLGSQYVPAAGRQDERDEAIQNLVLLNVLRSGEQIPMPVAILDALPQDIRDLYGYLYAGRGNAGQSIRFTVASGPLIGGGNPPMGYLRSEIASRLVPDEPASAGLRGTPWQQGDPVPTHLLHPPVPQPEPAAPTQPAPAPNSAGVGSGGGTGAPTAMPPADTTLAPAGTPRQIPGGAQLWNVDGRVLLAYQVPGHDVWMTWHVENPERLTAIYGGQIPDYDRTMTDAEYQALSPWYGGLSAELLNTSEHPWQQFLSDYSQAAALRPWLNDPSMIVVSAVAYLEGREPTQDELSQTDWWRNHTDAERAWMQHSFNLGPAELRRRQDDAQRAVADMLRSAGVNNAPWRLVRHIADRRLTGQWSDIYMQEQVRRLADPFAPGQLDAGVVEVLNGRELDQTRQFEDEVRQLAWQWLGPQFGQLGSEDVRRWAGRLRNDPDAGTAYTEYLRSQRMAMLPQYPEYLTYEDITGPVRRLAVDIWGQPFDDEQMLVDLANTRDYGEMTRRLRKTGLERGIRRVVEDAMSALSQTPLGERVVRAGI